MPDPGSPDAAHGVEDVVALAVVTAARAGDSLDSALTAAATLGDGTHALAALVGQIAGARPCRFRPHSWIDCRSARMSMRSCSGSWTE